MDLERLNGRAPVVSIVVPCRNERRYIADAVKSILQQEDIDGGFEVLVADGMSDDGTREILLEISRADSRLRVIDNPGRVVPTGLNAAIREARGRIIVRMDAHTEYAPDYMRRCVDVLLKTNSDNVGGPWNAKGRDYFQNAIAMGFRSRFGSGGAGSHNVDFEGEVDSVYLGCWKRQRLVELGLFDEEFVRNQDDELNLRLVKAGGKIWQSPLIKSWYYPRNSIAALFRQYRQYGYWKIRVIQKHRQPASLRHLVPGGFVLALLILAFGSVFLNFCQVGFAVLFGAYLAAALVASAERCVVESGWKYFPVMPLVFMAYHFGYGAGFVRGFLDFIVLRRGGSESFTRLTRSSK